MIELLIFFFFKHHLFEYVGKNDNVSFNEYSEQRMPSQQIDDQTYTIQHYESKIPLKLVMDPRGVIQDVHTQGITFDHNSGMLSPDKCAELVSALHTDSPKGKGTIGHHAFINNNKNLQ